MKRVTPDNSHNLRYFFSLTVGHSLFVLYFSPSYYHNLPLLACHASSIFLYFQFCDSRQKQPSSGLCSSLMFGRMLMCTCLDNLCMGKFPLVGVIFCPFTLQPSKRNLKDREKPLLFSHNFIFSWHGCTCVNILKQCHSVTMT